MKKVLVIGLLVFIAVFLTWPSYTYFQPPFDSDCDVCGAPAPQKVKKFGGGVRYTLKYFPNNKYEVRWNEQDGIKTESVVIRYFADKSGSFTEELFFQPLIALTYAGGGSILFTGLGYLIFRKHI